GRLFEPTYRNEDESLMRGSWVPAVDVAEEGDQLILRAELPGMKEDDIEIEFENGMLTLKGERQFESEQSERNYHRIERSYGNFVRSFTLPRSVDADAIQANYENGILEVRIPKKEEAKPRQIKIGKGS
ncbi:MAG: Hsp20/alpha crystallin family protein, partial [Thermoanaerobaculia bacterium]|nr:Hsp20/alpha crystallin family protein [Thermoanaerobaculia bacterium]